MSHFYARIPCSARQTMPTARGHKSTDIITEAAGWGGCIKTHVFYSESEGRDRFIVSLTPWQNSGGQYVILATGVLDANNPIIDGADYRDAPVETYDDEVES